MRRMIPGKLIEKIKSLFTSLWSDDEGNVEIGKNLEVDGEFSAIGGDFFADGGTGEYDTYKTIALIAEDDNYSIGFEIKHGQEPTGRVLFEASGEPSLEFIPHGPTGIIKLTEWPVEIEDSLKVGGVPFELYRHHLTLTTASGTDCQDYYSHSNLVVDSIQDLTTITGGHPFGSGAGYTYASNVWKHGSANVTAVTDDVQLVTN